MMIVLDLNVWIFIAVYSKPELKREKETKKRCVCTYLYSKSNEKIVEFHFDTVLLLFILLRQERKLPHENLFLFSSAMFSLFLHYSSLELFRIFFSVLFLYPPDTAENTSGREWKEKSECFQGIIHVREIIETKNFHFNSTCLKGGEEQWH